MKISRTWLSHMLVVGLHASSSTQAAIRPSPRASDSRPEQTIAGVSVVDTPIVRAAQDMARQYSSEYLYNHVMRSWLFGALIVNNNETLRQTVDLEVHAVAALLHDLGLDPNSTFVSSDRRFEVDGAFAARGFVESYQGAARSWDEHRLQLLWDSIALHSEHAISIYKEPTVQVVTNGIWRDFEGPGLGVTSQEYQAVVSAFPMTDFNSAFNQSLVWLCQTKPISTYDTWMQPFGDHFVANYSAVGHRAFDIVTGS